MNSHSASHPNLNGGTFASAVIIPRVREIRAANPNFDDYANALASFADEQFGPIEEASMRTGATGLAFIEMLAQFEDRIKALETRIQDLESGR